MVPGQRSPARQGDVRHHHHRAVEPLGAQQRRSGQQDDSRRPDHLALGGERADGELPGDGRHRRLPRRHQYAQRDAGRARGRQVAADVDRREPRPDPGDHRLPGDAVRPVPVRREGGIVQDDPRIRFALENQTRPVYSHAFFQQRRRRLRGDRARAGPPVVRRQRIGRELAGHLAERGFRDVRGVAVDAAPRRPRRRSRRSTECTRDAAVRPAGRPRRPARYSETPSTPVARRRWRRCGSASATPRSSQIIRTWAAKHQYGNGSTAQFIALAEQISGKSLDAFFKPWLYESGKPPYPKPMN